MPRSSSSSFSAAGGLIGLDWEFRFLAGFPLLHLCLVSLTYMCGVMMVILQFKSKQATSIKVYRQSCRQCVVLM
ncbi:hypothetical protein ZWY2020_034536 [Hordeum vulgare]|nr:hypothetical protein ZWY2020_034536 [Hordeum vulgare]